MQIFLSYRRGDAAGYTGRLYDGLVERLGEDDVFQDIFAIPPGEDFTVVLDRALNRADIVLAVIGPAWVSASSADGTQRLHNPDDYVRAELARALERDLPVVPVLVGGASIPDPAQLPDPLKGLARRQAVVLHDATWRRDVDDLVRRLRGKPVAARRPRWAAAAAALIVTLLAVAAVAVGLRERGADRELAGDLQPTAAGQPTATVAPVASEPAPAAVSCAPPAGQGWQDLELAPDPVGEWDADRDGVLVFRVHRASSRRLASRDWAVVLATSVENRASEERYHGDWHYEALVVGQRVFEPACFAPTPELVAAGTVGDALVGFEVRCEPVGYVELMLGEAQARIGVTSAPEPGAC